MYSHRTDKSASVNHAPQVSGLIETQTSDLNLRISIRCLCAPLGRRNVATGGAQRNPWFRKSNYFRPEGSEEVSRAIVPSPRRTPQPLPGLTSRRHHSPRVPHRRASPARCCTRGYTPTPLRGGGTDNSLFARARKWKHRRDQGMGESGGLNATRGVLAPA